MNKKQITMPPAGLVWDNPRFRNWVSVARAAHVVERAITDALKPLDMKPAHLDMMMNIHRHPGMSQQELAEKLIVGRSNVTMLLPSLIDRGLVQRTGDAKDRRIQRLELTANGTALLMQALEVYAQIIETAMSASTSDECDATGRQMERMIAALQKKD